MRRRPKLSTDVLSSLLKTLYGTALDPDQWPVFLKRFTQVLGLPAVAIHDHDFEQQRYQFNVSAGMDLSALSLYEKHFGKLDPYWPAFLKAREHELAFGEVLCPTPQLKKTEFYGDFLAKHEDVLGVYAAVSMVKQPSRWQAITIYRRLRDDHPDSGTARLVSAISPHIQSALHLQQHLSDLASARSGMEAGIDALGLAVLLLDDTGSNIFASQKAERILAHGDGLKLKAGRLSADRGPEAQALSTMIGGITKTANWVEGMLPAPVSISRKLKGTLRITGFPLSTSAARFSITTCRKAAAILFIRDIDNDVRPLPSLLAVIYGLTRAESRLALLLFEGRSLTESAAANGVSIETVRVQLKSIFQKTGVHRQSGLIRLLNELAKT